ncbi:hypothetical protein CLV58_1198 [Spirosoma oryzae]|uniref:Uncharacterized protein n=1 Tax=Spirosoma oryzae TaxID=1469603 RepID=A0A2T0SKC6_9BACT|nr:hypothetical protein [Spirosoma oryzae]PRY33859.1 hypothetical protein CLV58_1198 [Spirosoma oryzae]
MSIKTTHLVTREFAIAAIKKTKYRNPEKVKQLKDGRKLRDIPNVDLEYILEKAIHNGFYNFSIVDPEYFEANKNQPVVKGSVCDYFPGYPYLDDLDRLPEFNDAD